MSDLQRSFVKSKLSKLPPVPAFSEQEEEEAELASGDAFGSTSGPSSLSSTSLGQPRKRKQVSDFSPRTAAGYFEEALEVDVPLATGSASFRVYYTPPTLAPGASQRDGTVMVCHHGAGHSSLSFALFAKEVRERTRGECGVLALDARRHGAYSSNFKGTIAYNRFVPYHRKDNIIELAATGHGRSVLPFPPSLSVEAAQPVTNAHDDLPSNDVISNCCSLSSKLLINKHRYVAA